MYPFGSRVLLAKYPMSYLTIASEPVLTAVWGNAQPGHSGLDTEELS